MREGLNKDTLAHSGSAFLYMCLDGEVNKFFQGLCLILEYNASAKEINEGWTGHLQTFWRLVHVSFFAHGVAKTVNEVHHWGDELGERMGAYLYEPGERNKLDLGLDLTCKSSTEGLSLIIKLPPTKPLDPHHPVILLPRINNTLLSHVGSTLLRPSTNDQGGISRIVNLVTATIMVLGGITQLFHLSLYQGKCTWKRFRQSVRNREIGACLSSRTWHIPWKPYRPFASHMEPSQFKELFSSRVRHSSCLRGYAPPFLNFKSHHKSHDTLHFCFLSSVEASVGSLPLSPFYIFIGSIILGDNVFRIIAGSIISVVGVSYAIIEFIPQIEPPINMREAGAGWGAEQV
ncbi:hypothetical protein ACRALDRAFT_1090589 [Sodiomyces alcalophilus JCM 7366]|uniref:uncharacterized protein n=1 Tax=Sodiomyces alcalophilus JCM 7366 TaxID=591952 RepID=UPI0039B5256A